MALRITYETDHGINCTEAHCVISRTKCIKSGTRFILTYNGEIYYNEQSYSEGKNPISGFEMEYDLNSTDDNNYYNVIKECYEHLKTISGFDNGIDC
tara:strand:+ start:1752 stop:2042 length:291 start_codon:yes stop_codon:yes gene_type:complete